MATDGSSARLTTVVAFSPNQGGWPGAIMIDLEARQSDDTALAGHVCRGLSPGLYSVLAKREGYVGPATPGTQPTSTLITTTVTVTAGQTASVELSMQPGMPALRFPPSAQ
jgi:hypothetical protein